jgi:protein-tyrosine phosphatase
VPLVAELNAAAAAQGLQVRIVPGAEVHIAPTLPRELDRIATLNLTQYLLLELPFHHYPSFVEQVVFELQLRGMVPVMAHAERITHFQQHPEALATLVERGVLVQVTGGSVLGQFGSRAQAAAELMLRSGMAHVLASDGHWPTTRPPVLSAARARVSELIGDATATLLVETIPQRIVDGQPVDVPRPDLAAASTRPRWRFWRG